MSHELTAPMNGRVDGRGGWLEWKEASMALWERASSPLTILGTNAEQEADDAETRRSQFHARTALVEKHSAIPMVTEEKQGRAQERTTPIQTME